MSYDHGPRWVRLLSRGNTLPSDLVRTHALGQRGSLHAVAPSMYATTACLHGLIAMTPWRVKESKAAHFRQPKRSVVRAALRGCARNIPPPPAGFVWRRGKRSCGGGGRVSHSHVSLTHRSLPSISPLIPAISKETLFQCSGLSSANPSRQNFIYEAWNYRENETCVMLYIISSDNPTNR